VWDTGAPPASADRRRQGGGQQAGSVRMAELPAHDGAKLDPAAGHVADLHVPPPCAVPAEVPYQAEGAVPGELRTWAPCIPGPFLVSNSPARPAVNLSLIHI